MSLKDWISLYIPTPHYMSMSHVGVDISPTAIHLAEIKRNGSHLELGKYGAVQLPAPVNYNQPLIADEALVAALKKMQKEYHLEFVEVSIPEEHAYIFTMDLPMGDETTIRNHIELHLEENVPISLADAVFDYHVIEKPFEFKNKDFDNGNTAASAETSMPANQNVNAAIEKANIENAKRTEEAKQAEIEQAAAEKKAAAAAAAQAAIVQENGQLVRKLQIKSIPTEAHDSEPESMAETEEVLDHGPLIIKDSLPEPEHALSAQSESEPVSLSSSPDAETGAPVSLPAEVGMMRATGPTFFASISVVSKALLDQYIELFEISGMEPVSFVVENQAVSKSVIKKGDLSTKLIVHVSERKTVLSVVSKCSVHFTSTVNIGSEDFTTAIMKEFNVSREEAIRMKTEKGTADNSAGKKTGGKSGKNPSDKNQTAIFFSLINTASVLKDEIDRIILYWQSYVGKRGAITGGMNAAEFGGASEAGTIPNDGLIGSIVLSGRDCLVNGFKEYLYASVRLPVDTANVWTNVYDLNVQIPHIDYIDSLDYAVAIGLGLPRIGEANH